METLQLFNLTGKVALVTGGGRGLGRQIAEALADAGADIAVCSRKLETCQETADIIKGKGVEARGYACDISNEKDVDLVVEKVIEDFGRIDILVNNSGTTWGANVEDMPLEAWEKVMKINVTGTFLMSQKVGRYMIKQNYGKIINISSVAGIKAEKPEELNAIGYSTSKAAIIHFTKDLAMKWARHNINVNVIAPGFFPTKMTKAVLDAYGDHIKANTPLGRIGNDNDLKGAAVYLASPASDFVTGQILSIDGGTSL